MRNNKEDYSHVKNLNYLNIKPSKSVKPQYESFIKQVDSMVILL